MCKNSIYVVPPCEWILHMLPQTLWSTEDSVTIVTLLVDYVHMLGGALGDMYHVHAWYISAAFSLDAVCSHTVGLPLA